MEIKVRSILQQALDDLNELASAKKDEEIYINQTEAKAQALLEYITGLQRKEYNNSKAIELIHKLLSEEVVIEDYESMYYGEKCQRSYFSDSELGQVLNILEKGE